MVPIEVNHFRAVLTHTKGPCSSPPDQQHTFRKIVFVLKPTCQGAGCQGISQSGKIHDVTDSTLLQDS